jgi:hypothetical protein
MCFDSLSACILKNLYVFYSLFFERRGFNSLGAGVNRELKQGVDGRDGVGRRRESTAAALASPAMQPKPNVKPD